MVYDLLSSSGCFVDTHPIQAMATQYHCDVAVATGEAVSGGQHPVLINEGPSTKVPPIRSEADLPGPFSGLCIFAVNNSPGSWNAATGLLGMARSG